MGVYILLIFIIINLINGLEYIILDQIHWFVHNKKEERNNEEMEKMAYRSGYASYYADRSILVVY